MKIIDKKNVDMTEDEWNYYLGLVKHFTDKTIQGTTYFEDLFATDEKGYITMIMPKKDIPWLILFFIQNLMINQRLKDFEYCMEKINKLEKIINKQEKNDV